MRIMVTGAKGQLGHEVMAELAKRQLPHIGVDIGDFDITDESQVFSAIEAYRPQAVIHSAAYTAVDKAEDEPELCTRINADGSGNIAKACDKFRAKMVYVSTDYVFPGTGQHFHKPHDDVGPLSVYGMSKLSGERQVAESLSEHFIVRTSWVFGKNGPNFVKTMLRLGKERETINIVDDQIGSPTYAADLSPLLIDMCHGSNYGIYHATNEGICSWAEFAQEIFRLASLSAAVNPIPSSEYPTKAKRPLNSRLCKSCLDEGGFQRLSHWKEALEEFIRE